MRNAKPLQLSEQLMRLRVLPLDKIAEMQRAIKSVLDPYIDGRLLTILNCPISGFATIPSSDAAKFPICAIGIERSEAMFLRSTSSQPRSCETELTYQLDKSQEALKRACEQVAAGKGP